MTQLQEPPPHSPATASKASLGCFFQACSWGWGILALTLGGMRISATPLHGAVAILLGVLLLPPIRRLIGKRIGLRLAAPVAISLALLIMGIMVVIGRDITAEQKIEKQKQAVIDKERTRRENAFIASHPHVDRDSLRAWRETAADSTTDPELTLASFLRRQEELHGRRLADSITSARQRHDDSITQAKQWHKDSIASAKSRISDSIEAARAARRASIEQERPIQRAQSAPETYNGHIIYTGPRGGRYYINANGNKTYIR